MRWLNRHPGRLAAFGLAALPFALAILGYAVASDLRRAANPADKLLPAPEQILSTALSLATEPDRRSGEILLWLDTGASLLRLAEGLYLEAIAVDPAAEPQRRPRWFDLDRFEGAPRISNWICRCADLDTALHGLPDGAGRPLALAQGCWPSRRHWQAAERY